MSAETAANTERLGASRLMQAIFGSLCKPINTEDHDDGAGADHTLDADAQQTAPLSSIMNRAV